MKRFIEWGENCMVSSHTLFEGLGQGAKLDAGQTLSPTLSHREREKDSIAVRDPELGT